MDRFSQTRTVASALSADKSMSKAGMRSSSASITSGQSCWTWWEVSPPADCTIPPVAEPTKPMPHNAASMFVGIRTVASLYVADAGCTGAIRQHGAERGPSMMQAQSAVAVK